MRGDSRSVAHSWGKRPGVSSGAHKGDVSGSWLGMTAQATEMVLPGVPRGHPLLPKQPPLLVPLQLTGYGHGLRWVRDLTPLRSGRVSLSRLWEAPIGQSLETRLTNPLGTSALHTKPWLGLGLELSSASVHTCEPD